MPVQTTKTQNVYYPDGCKVEVDTGSGYFDLGATNSSVTNTLSWQENRVETANAGPLSVQIRQMQMEGSFTLVNLDPEGVEKLGGGMFTRVATSGTESSLDNQAIAAGWTDMGRNAMLFIDSVDATAYQASAAPTITSVTGATAGVLAADDDYFVIADTSASSGYSIQLNTNGTAGLVTTEIVTIVYTSVSAVSSEVVYMGKSTDILSAYSMRLTHTDDNSKVRRLELFSVDTGAGGIAFNFKGSNEDGIEEMPISYIAKLDSSRTSGQQLAAWTIDTDAE